MGVFDGGAVASHEDGVEHGEGAADAEDEAEEDADEGTGEEVHQAMVCPVWARGRLSHTIGGRLSLRGDLRGEWRSVGEE